MELTEQQQKCKDCRECCEYVEFPVTMLSMEVVEYFRFRGNRFYLEKGGALMVRVHDPCRHLTPAGCAIYDDRPDTCRKYMCEYGDKRIKTARDETVSRYMDEIDKVIIKWRAEKEIVK